MLKAAVLILTALLLDCSGLGRSLRIFMPPSGTVSFHIAFFPVFLLCTACVRPFIFFKIPVCKGDYPSVSSTGKSVSVACFVRVRGCS
jgi:hypothetical protein